MAITSGEVLNAQVRVRNNEDAKYSIVADVQINKVADEYGGNNGNGQISGGAVSNDGQTLATFSKYNNLSINYSISDNDTQTEILALVQTFCTETEDFATNTTLTATNE